MVDRESRRAERALSDAIVDPESFRSARVRRLVDMLRSDDRGTRLSASWAIGLVVAADPPAIDPHVERLAEALENEEYRRDAVRTLAYVGEHRPEAAREVQKILDVGVESADAPMLYVIPGYDPDDPGTPLSGGSIDHERRTKPRPEDTEEAEDANSTSEQRGLVARKQLLGRPASSGDRPPERPPRPPGRIEARLGEFEINRLRGSWPHVKTYRSHYEQDGTQVPVTLRRYGEAVDHATGERFDEELSIWAGLDHDAIAAVSAWGTVPDPWVVHEHTSGGSIRDRRGPVPIDEALWLLDRVVESVAAGHQFGVTHGALSPAAVEFVETFEDRWNYPKLVDWGTTRAFEDRRRYPPTGVAADAAPEQLDPDRFGTIDAATDVYHLGVIAYETLAGRPPFVAGNVRERIRSEPPMRIHEANPNVPTELAPVVEKCLAKRKEERYDSVQGLRSGLARVREAIA